MRFSTKRTHDGLTGQIPLLFCLSFKIEDELHQGLKIGVAMEGRTIAEILKELIQRWVKGRDPFIHHLQNMPVTPDEEDISPTTRKSIKSALHEKSGGTWQELSAELPPRRRK